MGDPVKPDYPYAPDSTIAHWTLPRPLLPGDSTVVEVDWRARPSTLPRRQGRRGRRFDFAQWYPKVAVYDRFGWEDHPLYPAGEFYGEFATYDVTLDLPEDQVIGATGVPVEGDPGWEHAKADPQLRIDYQREWYSSLLPGPRCAELKLASGRKCVRFRAQQVHHFAFSLNPRYMYEEGRYDGARGGSTRDARTARKAGSSRPTRASGSTRASRRRCCSSTSTAGASPSRW